MAARRLLIVMLVLLGISVLGGTLLPSPGSQEGTETTETQTKDAEPKQKGKAADPVPRGELRRYTLEVTPERTFKIEVEVGDQLLLTVHSKKPDQVEIPRLGLIETMDKFAPAKFDLLIVEPGSYPIRLVEAKREVGRIAALRP